MANLYDGMCSPIGHYSYGVQIPYEMGMQIRVTGDIHNMSCLCHLWLAVKRTGLHKIFTYHPTVTPVWNLHVLVLFNM